MNRIKTRMKRELELMNCEPPPGISCWCEHDDITTLKATIIVLDESPFEKGMFQLDVNLTNRYPFEPPIVKFTTPVYHPNVDSGGRICLDLLKMPPKGNWKPSLNISSILQSIQVLMSNPNPDDPLMADIAREFLTDKQTYLTKAKAWTLKYASNHQEVDTKVAAKRQSKDSVEVIPNKKTRNVLGEI